MHQYYDVPNGLEIVNLGSTFAKYGFDYQLFGKRGFNFAGQPQPLKEDHAILSQYQDHLKPSAVVLIVLICPFVFSLYDYVELEPASSEGGIVKIKKTIKKVIGADNISALKCKINKMRHRKDTTFSAEEKSCIMAQKRVDGWKEEFSLMDTVSVHPSEELKRVFAKTRRELTDILLLCRERGFCPVLMDMPVAKAEHSMFSKAFIREFYDENIKKANVIDAPTLRYFGDERFDDALLYENYTDCFNDFGRRKFAEILINDLRKLNVEKE